MPGLRMDDLTNKFIPWGFWGRYAAGSQPRQDPLGRHEVSADTHTAPAGFNTIEFIYRTDVNDANSVVNRVFRLVGVKKRAMYTAVTVNDGGKEWTVQFKVDDDDDDDTMNLLVRRGEEVHRPLPMTDKYWAGRFGMWPVLGISAVWVSFLLFLLYYWYYYG